MYNLCMKKELKVVVDKHNIRIVNDIDLALDIMHKASDWMARKGILVADSWKHENLNLKYINNNTSATEKDFYVFYDNEVPFAAGIALNARNAYIGLLPYKFKNSLYVGKGCVLDDYHGGKYSRLRLKACMKKAKQEGYDSVLLDVAEYQKPLWKLYEELGFKMVDTFKDDDEPHTWRIYEFKV